MTTILLVIHMFLALGLVVVILLQRSEGGALGIGGGGGMMTARGQANFLTRATAVLAGLFIVTSLTLAILASHNRKSTSVLDTVPAQGQPAQPGKAPAQPQPQPAKPAQPAEPAAPLGR